MASHAVTQLAELKKALEKSMKDGKETTSERLMDILKAIQAIPMTPSLIKESKLGKTLSTLRAKYAAQTSTMPEVANLARDIMAAWKHIVEVQVQKEQEGKPSGTVDKPQQGSSPLPIASVATASSSSSAHKKITKGGEIVSATSSSSSNSSSSVVQIASSELASYPDGRRKAIRLLADQIKLSTTDEALAMRLAMAIDKAIDDLPQHSYDLDNKSYMNKLRSLVFNIKRNESLRADLVSGALAPTLFVTLAPADLATNELRQARQGVAAADMESRRTDWLEEHKVKIQEGIGIDPANTWDFQNDDDESVGSVGQPA